MNIKFFLYYLFFIYGAAFGSFFNVCIYRIPRGISLITPPSSCPSCHQRIPWYYNIPLFGYFILKGRCYKCKKPISIIYPLTETIIAFVALGCSFYFKDQPLSIFISGTIIYFIFISGLFVLSVIDYRFLIIPDRYTIGGVAAGVIISYFFPWIHKFSDSVDGLIFSFSSAIICFSSLFAVRFAGNIFYGRESLGFGDVKLVAAFGAFLGWKLGLLSIFFAALTGSVTGIMSIIINRSRLRSEIPFGPFLSLGAIISLFGGEAFLNWYSDFVCY